MYHKRCVCFSLLRFALIWLLVDAWDQYALRVGSLALDNDMSDEQIAY